MVKMMPNQIKVMIVDDEILAIEDLEQLIPWRQHGFEIVATATGSQKALELYEKHRPQIIFVDIRMPAMDGLEFSRRVLAYRYPVRIVLLTAYKDFEYAQQAVALGVSNYLLKHDVNEASLLKELNKLRDDLENTFRRDAIVKQRLIKRILTGESPGDWSGGELRLINQNPENLALLLIHPVTPYLERFKAISGMHPVKISDIKEVPLPDGIYCADGFDLDELGFIVLVGMKRVNSQAEERERLYQYALALQNYLCEANHQNVAIIISRSCAQIEVLPLLYQRMIRARQYLVFYHPKQILCSDDLPVITGLQTTDIDRDLQILAQSLRETDCSGVQSAIGELFQGVLSSRNPEQLKRICDELLERLEHYRNHHGLSSLMELHKQGKLNLESLSYYTGLQDWFRDQFDGTIRQVFELNQGRYSKKVQQAISHIRQHYAADLTVENVAGALGISGVYLSQLFKKETHRTFLEYLTEHRIKIAKDLLQSGDYKIYEVAAMVGYKTSQYFSHVFRKVTGVYPVDYREGATRNETGD
ncbi:MAG TPA: response regulator [Bacillota bacterium]